MDAVISGRAGRALLLGKDSLKSFDVDDPSKIVSRQQSDLPYLFGETQDLRAIENTDIESVRQELKHDCEWNWALDLALISLDAELPDDIRKEAIEGLDELLADDRVIVRLENILYARPLPEDGDLAGALRLCDAAHSSNAFALLQRFQEQQPLILEVSAAWDTIPTKTFGDYKQQAEFQYVAVREGLFPALVEVRDGQSTTATFFLNTGLNASIKQLRNYRQVLQHWISQIPQIAAAPKLKHVAEEEFEVETSTRRRHGRRIGLNRRAVLKEVNNRKAIITGAMHRRDLVLVHELVDDLVSYQLSNGEPVHTAKSLCDLAMEAKTLGLNSLQLELTERSINIAPDDDWSWAQYGDALLNMQRLDDALEAYRQADAFGAGVVSKFGRAEVLKAMNRLDDALAAYDEAIAEYPEDVVAKRGRAELLKVIGRLDEALNAYDEIIADNLSDVIARNGRAEVLKAMNRLDDALAAYDEAIAAHPEDVVAKHGRAELLKVIGRLDEALNAYDEIIADNLSDVIARNGRSGVLVALHRYDDALEHLPAGNPVTQDDWIGYHMRGMILLRQGKVSEAISVFEWGVQNDPLPSSKQYFQTALAVAMLRRRDFPRVIQVLEGVSAPLLQPQANVLRLHSFGELKEDMQASEAYDKLASKPWSIPDNLIDELHRRYILKEEPQHNDEWVFEKEEGIILLVANQQAMLSSSYAY
jgi:tetratricopeptide (TPR) repeat protein